MESLQEERGPTSLKVHFSLCRIWGGLCEAEWVVDEVEWSGMAGMGPLTLTLTLTAILLSTGMLLI